MLILKQDIKSIVGAKTVYAKKSEPVIVISEKGTDNSGNKIFIFESMVSKKRFTGYMSEVIEIKVQKVELREKKKEEIKPVYVKPNFVVFDTPIEPKKEVKKKKKEVVEKTPVGERILIRVNKIEDKQTKMF